MDFGNFINFLLEKFEVKTSTQMFCEKFSCKDASYNRKAENSQQFCNRIQKQLRSEIKAVIVEIVIMSK